MLTFANLKVLKYSCGKFYIPFTPERTITCDEVSDAILLALEHPEEHKRDEFFVKLKKGVGDNKLVPEIVARLFMYEDNESPINWSIFNRGDGTLRSAEIMWGDKIIGYVQDAEFSFFDGEENFNRCYSEINRMIVGRNYFEFRGLKCEVIAKSEAGSLTAEKLKDPFETCDIAVVTGKHPDNNKQWVTFYMNGEETDRYVGFKYLIGNRSEAINELVLYRKDGFYEIYRGKDHGLNYDEMTHKHKREKINEFVETLSKDEGKIALEKILDGMTPEDKKNLARLIEKEYI